MLLQFDESIFRYFILIIVFEGEYKFIQFLKHSFLGFPICFNSKKNANSFQNSFNDNWRFNITLDSF